MQTDECVAAELGAVWARSRPLILDRVATIEAATAELGRSPARPQRVEAGQREAHRLAGSLGTFGLDHGTELARELEQALADPGPSPDGSRLQRLASELRTTVELAGA